MRHLLKMADLTGEEWRAVLAGAVELKAQRGRPGISPLSGQTWAMIFLKSSTRTRVSFEVGVRELGGAPMFLSGSDMQLGRGEPIKDTARVLGRIVHGAIIRTFSQVDIEEFAAFSRIPTINALTDDEHPCQIAADLLTIQERFGNLKQHVCFIGDGACNVPRSWISAAGLLGFPLTIAAPPEFQPTAEFLTQCGAGHVRVTDDLMDAVKDADVLYTDVFVSMGKEAEGETRLKALAGYQINAQLMAAAPDHAMVMHCLPAYRGKEITDEVFEAHADTIFTQAENRLHAQKSVLRFLVES